MLLCLQTIYFIEKRFLQQGKELRNPINAAIVERQMLKMGVAQARYNTELNLRGPPPPPTTMTTAIAAPDVVATTATTRPMDVPAIAAFFAAQAAVPTVAAMQRPGRR